MPWPSKKSPAQRQFSRRTLLKASAATLGAAAFPLPAIAQSKPFAGVTLHGASFQHRFFTLLQTYIPEFEEKTGMKVDLQLSAFPVYNQQANLELSSGGSAYDFCNVTFILAARWVAAGLLANLDEFTADRTSRRPTGIRRISSKARRCLIATPKARPTATPGKAAPC